MSAPVAEIFFILADYPSDPREGGGVSGSTSSSLKLRSFSEKNLDTPISILGWVVKGEETLAIFTLEVFA